MMIQHFVYPHIFKDIDMGLFWSIHSLNTFNFTYRGSEYTVNISSSDKTLSWEEAYHLCDTTDAGHLWTVSDEDELRAVLKTRRH